MEQSERYLRPYSSFWLKPLFSISIVTSSSARSHSCLRAATSPAVLAVWNDLPPSISSRRLPSEDVASPSPPRCCLLLLAALWLSALIHPPGNASAALLHLGCAIHSLIAYVALFSPVLQFYVIAAMQKYLSWVDLSYPKRGWLALPWESADRPSKPWESSVLFWDLAAPSSKAVSIALPGGLSCAFLYSGGNSIVAWGHVCSG